MTAMTRKEAAAAKREAFKALAASLSEMTAEHRHEIVASHGGIRTIEGHTMSPFNSCLVIRQNNEATIVGGYQQWQRAGRQVKTGQSGLMIWVPASFKVKDESGETGEKKTGFVIGHVFDITQTEPIEAGNA